MANALPWGKHAPLLLALPMFVLPLLVGGQRSSTPALQPQAHERQPQFQDWSTRHTLYSRYGTMAVLEAANRDPRALFRWRESERRELAQRAPDRFGSRFDSGRSLRAPWRPGPGRFPVRSSADVHRDWSIYLGLGGTPPGMFPAKYVFDTTVAPDCANDFVVFPINADGSATQANIVAINNLYSGTTPANGVCNRATTSGGTDTRTSATVMWAYNVQGITAGTVPTSPVLSLDGKKVAFVESATGAAHFHVLAWASGDGVDAANKQNTLKPKVLSSGFATNAPSAGSVTDLNFGSSTDTLSSPYVDYARDIAYVGNDAGVLFRFKNIFCTAAACGTAPPSLDTTWGTGGSVAVCSGKLTGPVQDVSTDNVYVGCSDGKLYALSVAGVVIGSLAVGDGVANKTYGAIIDPPLVDGGNGFVYVTSGSANNGASGVLVQTKLNLTSSVVANIGLGNRCNAHSPTPNNAYLTNITSAGSLMYVGGLGTNGTVTQPCTGGSTGTAHLFLYGVSFGAGGTMNGGTPAKSVDEGVGQGYEWVPPLEFFNTASSTDWLFIAAIQSAQVDIAVANITGGFPTTFTTIEEGVGISGMIVDNAAKTTGTGSFPQASSIYFNALQENAACTNKTNGALTGGCAVKLTQSGLQ
jgi:hypothetical protein